MRRTLSTMQTDFGCPRRTVAWWANGPLLGDPFSPMRSCSGGDFVLRTCIFFACVWYSRRAMRTYFHMPRAFAVHCLSKPPTTPPAGRNRSRHASIAFIDGWSYRRCLVYFWPLGSLATIRSRRSNCSVEHPQDLGARATTAMDPGLTPQDAVQAPSCLDYWLGSDHGLGPWPLAFWGPRSMSLSTDRPCLDDQRPEPVVAASPTTWLCEASSS